MLEFDIMDNISDLYPIIIKPNIGQPLFIDLRKYHKKNNEFLKDIYFDTIFIGRTDLSIDQIKDILSNNLYLQPILRDTGSFKKRRGNKYQLEIIDILKKKFVDIKKIDLHKNEELYDLGDIYYTLKKNSKSFNKRDSLIKIRLKINDIDEIYTILKELNKSFLLFDIIQDIPLEKKKRIVFHSLALFDKNWDNFHFIHATDSHVSRRNDIIFKFLREKSLKEKNHVNNDFFFLNRKYEFREEFQVDKYQFIQHGMYNFNDNLRIFISNTNEKVRQNKLDFVFFTGDLIDYIGLANYDDIYKNNYQFLLDILLGITRESDGKDEELPNKQEILAPIFTILGNHDYRLGHYSIFMGKIYRIFGLEKHDIKDYRDDKYFNGIKALYSKTRFLKDYFLFINPNRNFKLNIGKQFLFIFLDSGKDSIANLLGLMRGAPSTRGLNKIQIKLLRYHINQSNIKHIVILMHAPPISPKLNKSKKKKLKKKFNLGRKIEWFDFYEENIKKYTGKKSLESILNLKDQTLIYRWGTLMDILSSSESENNKKIDLVLCGHTHTLKEFRLKKNIKSKKKRVNMGFYFIPLYVHIPCKIYTNRYRNIIKNFTKESDLNNWFNVNKPFILHTQGLGSLSYKIKVKAPGFRYITVKNNQIMDFSVYSLFLK